MAATKDDTVLISRDRRIRKRSMFTHLEMMEVVVGSKLKTMLVLQNCAVF